MDDDVVMENASTFKMIISPAKTTVAKTKVPRKTMCTIIDIGLSTILLSLSIDYIIISELKLLAYTKL